MGKVKRLHWFLPLLLLANSSIPAVEDNSPMLFWWNEDPFTNFGDYISVKLVERIISQNVSACGRPSACRGKKILAIGSILSFARNGDVVWGSGINGKLLKIQHYKFTNLDIRAVRGPLTRQIFQEKLHIECPEVYGDPALLLPYFFPEFKRKAHPSRKYIVIPHYSERHLFPKSQYPEVVYPTDPWDQVIESILDSEFVISSSLHGIVVAEAFGIPARLLRITEKESLFKYQDYYQGTNRPFFEFATSIEEAFRLGGEIPPECDLQKLYAAFPFELWPDTEYIQPDFTTMNRTYENTCFMRDGSLLAPNADSIFK